MKLSRVITVLLVLGLPLQSFAEDIDLFLGTPPANGVKPNVLLILDNTANWNTAFETEKAALVDTFDNMDPNAFNVGLMMFGESPELGYVKAAIRPMSDTVPRSATDPNQVTYNTLYADMIDRFCVSSGNCSETGLPGDGANARSLSRTFSEAYRYLTGSRTVDDNINTGQGKNAHREYPENTYSTPESTAVHNLPFPALGGEPDFVGQFDFDYLEPPGTGLCGKTYVIYIGNTIPSGNVQKDKPSRNRPAGAELAAVGGDTNAIDDGYTLDGVFYDAHHDNYADEWARYMHDEMGVIFYAIDIDPAPIPGGNANGIGNSLMIKSLSQGVGGGRYLRASSADPNDIGAKLGSTLAQIQAENSVFASVALPASTTGQSVFLNQVFIGLFRPDGSAYPRWPGNLKQYKLGLDGGVIKLVDARPDLALNPSTGFIDDCARSYWTAEDPDTYWDFSPSGTCKNSAGESLATSDSPDGPYVEKGAQSHVMRSAVPTAREVWTCDYTLTSCTTATPFDPNTITGSSYETLFQADDPNDLAQLVTWAIGVDLDDDNIDTDKSDTRAWIHGDVIHSRPIALNYGDRDNPAVIVYYGANDGMLRAINGNQVDDAFDYAPGEELWSFMPPEFYGEIKRLRVNTETVKFPATGPDAGTTGTRKAYGMDGVITAFEGDAEVGGTPKTDLKYIYATMRRGGRAIYAFDVSDPNDPGAQLAWKKGCDASGCSGGIATGAGGDWTDIGETWSGANVAYVNGRTNPVLIMGGGYDECEDVDSFSGNENHDCAAADHGDHIYVMDAISGELLKVFDTLRAVPGGITIVPITDPTNANPTPDIAFAYATDTGGNVYRISGPLDDTDNNTSTADNATVIGSTSPANWELTRIASFGCDTIGATCDANRKFLFGPDVVRSLSDGAIFRVLVGSGDREKPIINYSATTDVGNYFYSFVDQPLAASAWLDVDTDCGVDVICHGLMEQVTTLEVVTGAGREVQIVVPDGVDLAAAKGYKLKLADTEQVVTGALVVGDIANFSTHVPYDVDKDNDPDADVCQNKLGNATTYNIGFENAEGEGIDIFTGGLVPTPVAGLVELCEGGICTKEPFCIGCGGENSPIGGGDAGAESSYEQSKGKVYWNIEQ